MKIIEVIQIVLFFGLGIALTPVVGKFMAKVYKGERTFLHPVFLPVENLIYRLTGIDPNEEMTWLRYFWAVLLFAFVGFASLMAIFMTQAWLPLNPAKLPNCSWHLAFMQAWSFTCNADWQSYAGETTMSYFTQMTGMTVHNFTSAATGIAAMVAFIRAFARQSVSEIGNFWVDLTRSIVYLLLPLSIVLSVVFVSQGMIQNLKPYTNATTLEGKVQVNAPGSGYILQLAYREGGIDAISLLTLRMLFALPFFLVMAAWSGSGPACP